MLTLLRLRRGGGGSLKKVRAGGPLTPLPLVNFSISNPSGPYLDPLPYLLFLSLFLSYNYNN